MNFLVQLIYSQQNYEMKRQTNYSGWKNEAQAQFQTKKLQKLKDEENF